MGGAIADFPCCCRSHSAAAWPPGCWERCLWSIIQSSAPILYREGTQVMQSTDNRVSESQDNSVVYSRFFFEHSDEVSWASRNTIYAIILQFWVAQCSESFKYLPLQVFSGKKKRALFSLRVKCTLSSITKKFLWPFWNGLKAKMGEDKN